jgi:hypothetical protein
MRRLFLKLLRRKRLGRDLDIELAFHREMSAQHQNPVGLGNISLVKEQALDLWRFNLIENLWRDLLYAVRGLASSRALVISALLSLGLGIGANTAIFQLLDAIRLKTLPVQNPQQLAELKIEGGHKGMAMNPGEYPELTRPIWEELRRRQQPFSGIFAWAADRVNVGEGSQMRRVRAMWVSGDFFRVLGIQPWRGRLISPEDEAPCPETVAVVSYAFWQNSMGGGALGRTWISRKGEVIGVTPPNFFGLSVGDSFDIAFPFASRKRCPATYSTSRLWVACVQAGPCSARRSNYKALVRGSSTLRHRLIAALKQLRPTNDSNLLRSRPGMVSAYCASNITRRCGCCSRSRD